jgi:biopolymer transport protein ExbB
VRSRRRSAEALDRALQEAALRELPVLNRRLGVLDTIITLSPLLGLLGTVTGMIQSFQVVATASGASAAPAITGGVAEALIATATGLAVAIATLPVYNSLTERVKEVSLAMEHRATEFQNALADLAEEQARAQTPRPTVVTPIREGSPAPHATAPAA